MKIYILLFKEENTTNNRIKEYESQHYHQNQKITYDIYIRFEKIITKVLDYIFYILLWYVDLSLNMKN